MASEPQECGRLEALPTPTSPPGEQVKGEEMCSSSAFWSPYSGENHRHGKEGFPGAPDQALGSSDAPESSCRSFVSEMEKLRPWPGSAGAAERIPFCGSSPPPKAGCWNFTLPDASSQAWGGESEF